MRVLIDIVHPADVLFFKRPIETFLARGDQVSILSRHKDISCALLDGFGFEHRPVSRAGTGKIALLRELIARDYAVLSEIRRFRPDVMLGFGGVAIAHAGRLSGTPSVAFYDSENARLQTRITWPFVTHLYVPDSYNGPVPKGRTTRLNGTKDLSYLHPSTFQPDPDIAKAEGLDPTQDNFFLRIVDWRANHDLGKSGWDAQTLRTVVKWLASRGKLHLSSERPLPNDLSAHRYNGAPDRVHHLIAHCSLLVGESATMACEAATLGVPGIYAGRDFPGYVHALEKKGLIQTLSENTPEVLISALQTALDTKAQVHATSRAYIDECPDWGNEVVQAADKHAKRR